MICDRTNCTGCQACASICPVKCISMQDDERGFLYPVIDASKCVHCNKCAGYCPTNILKSENISTDLDVYLAWALDSDVVKSSSSGGMFSAWAKQIIKKGGYVSGAIFDENFYVKHIVSNKLSDITRMAKSKYVQSDVSGVYSIIGEILLQDKDVLFCGTACQVYGLKAYLLSKKIESDNLITFDVICHGVPSPKVWKHYLSWQKEKHQSDIKYICMRYKEYTKHEFVTKEAMKIDFTNGDTYIAYTLQDIFKRAFHKDLISRESCYHCQYKTVFRISDITIGDCWFSDYLTNDSKVPYDVTLCIPHSRKGKEIITNSNMFGFRKVDSFDAIKINNGMIYSSVSPNKDSNSFFEMMEQTDFESLVKQYTHMDQNGIKQTIKRIIHHSEKMLPHISRYIRKRNRKNEFYRRLQNKIPDDAMEKRYL